MSITGYVTSRSGNIITVMASSDLSGTIYYHWYLDGVLVASSQSATYSVYLPIGEQAILDVIDTNDADYDAVGNAPEGHPARRVLWWTRTLDPEAALYRIDQQKDGGAWTEVGSQPQDNSAWEYTFMTEKLTDLSTYSWRIVFVDAVGNDGYYLETLPEKIVRTPDAPDYTISFDAGTTKVTFAEAA